MIEGLIETLLSQLRQMFYAGSASAMEMVLDALDTLPTPTLTEGIFRSLYVRVWGFAVFVSLITGVVGMFIGMTSQRRGLTPTQSLLYFLRVYLQAIVLPVAVALGILLSDLLVTAALSVPTTEIDPNALVNLPGPAGVVDELLATVLAGFNWLFGWILAIWVLVLTWGVLPLMVIAVAMSPLAPLGKDPGGFMRRSYNWIAAAIAGRVVVALVLVVGIISVELVNQVGIALLSQLFQLATLIAALWMSWGLKSKIESSEAMAVWIPTPITANLIGGSQTTSANLQAIKTGVTDSRQNYTKHQTQSTARVRHAVSSGLTTTAAATPDPRVKSVAAIGAWLAEASAKKSDKKAEGGDDG